MRLDDSRECSTGDVQVELPLCHCDGENRSPLYRLGDIFDKAAAKCIDRYVLSSVNLLTRQLLHYHPDRPMRVNSYPFGYLCRTMNSVSVRRADFDPRGESSRQAWTRTAGSSPEATPSVSEIPSVYSSE